MVSKLSSLALFASVLILAGTAQAADTYEIDPPHTQALFKVGHLGVSNQWGRFNDVSGTVVFDSANPAQSNVSITIKAESVDTANAKRDEHLRGPDFFNAKQFPTLTFRSTKVTKKNEKTYDVTGDLTIHGTTKSITVPFTLVGMGKGPRGEDRAGGESQFKVSRLDYGVSYKPELLGVDVEIFLTFEGIKK